VVAERQLVLDANILIRAVLGRCVRQIITEYADSASISERAYAHTSSPPTGAPNAHRPTGLQGVNRSVAAIGGLQHHLRTLTRASRDIRETIHHVDDPDRLENLAFLGGPHNHRTATM